MTENDEREGDVGSDAAASGDNRHDLLGESVHEAEDLFDAETGSSASEVPAAGELSADSDIGSPSGEGTDAEQPSEPIDAELAAEVSKGLQMTLHGMSAGRVVPTEPLAPATRYRRVRTVEIEIDPPLTQPLTLGLAGGESLFVLDRPQTDRFRVIRVPVSGGRGQAVVQLDDGSGENGLRDPVGIAVDDEGRIHIPDSEDNCVKVFSADGRWLQTFETAGERGAAFDHPRDVDIAADGHLYIADTYNNRIVKLTNEGDFVWEFEQFTHPETGDADNELFEPSSVCVAGGRVAIADTNRNRIVTISEDGQVQSILASDGSFEFPTEVRITDEGVTYVGDHSNLRVQRFAPDGTLNGIIDLRQEDQELSGGGDIDVDADGNVVVIDPVRESIVVLGLVSPE